MKQKVTFELLSPVMCGGIRIAHNFLESEAFIRGSVLRAAFANLILLECPVADRLSKDGKYNFIEIKDEDGFCKECPKKEICSKFSDMRFSFAYRENCIPVPFTARMCKTFEFAHPIKDTIIEKGMLKCDECTGNGQGRMESIKGMIKLAADGKAEKCKTDMCLSTHTAINYCTGTADDGSLFSVKAIKKGQAFTAVIDDCDTGMLKKDDIIYAGKYFSCGFGKMKITDTEPYPECTEQDIADKIKLFNQRFGKTNMAAVLFLSDAYPYDAKIPDNIQNNEVYLDYWTRALFEENELPFTVKSMLTETQLYSGYDTSKKWGDWKLKKPELLIMKGTSLLLEIKEGCIEEAVKLLTDAQNNGIGRRTENGFGQVEICHPIHCIGVKKS